MPCERIDTETGPAFLCGRLPKDRPRKCSVCKAATSTLLCDGDTGGGVTCDAPLCEACTTRPAPGVIGLPPHDDNASCNPMEMVHWRRRRAARLRRESRTKFPEQKTTPESRLPSGVESDTRDFCPSCAEKLRRGPRPVQLGLL